MDTYFAAKIAEYRTLIRWAENQLDALVAASNAHAVAIDRLRKKVRELGIQLNVTLKHTILKSDTTDRLDRAFEFLRKDLDFWFAVIKNYYIPALASEGPEDKKLGQIMLTTARSIGLDWLNDFVICMTGHPSTWAVFPDSPLIFCPLSHNSSFIEMPALFHELGHDVCEQNKDGIFDDLFYVIEHFLTTKMEDATEEQAKNAIRDAIRYWANPSRLIEIICDIFATYCCGPSHLFSCMDGVVRLLNNPVEINRGDQHPPGVTRVAACFLTLTTASRAEDLVQSRMSFFDTFCKRFPPNPDLEIACSQELLSRMVTHVVGNLSSFMSPGSRYEAKLPESPDAADASPGDSLAVMLNKAAYISLTTPTDYQRWEQRNFAKWREGYLKEHM